MSQSGPKNIIVVGGSLGGLFTGTALKRLRRNLNIRIFERNPTPLLHDQGAGVVAGEEVQKFFKTYDRTQTPLTISSQQRLYLDKSGDVIDREDSRQQMTSWDLLYHLLRTNFDGTKTEYAEVPEAEEGQEEVSYEYGCIMTDIQVPTNVAEPVNITVKRHSGETFTTDADLIVAADGPSSSTRAMYFPDIKRRYAGYVAWRGTVSEHEVSKAAADVFIQKFSFFHTKGTQILAYTIPGKHGTLEPGKRLLNWVWYENYKESSPEHIELMTDKDGKRHHITLPAGGIQDDVWTRQKNKARETLPPQFSELVEKTEVPFIQAITDVLAPSALLEGGRVLLLGDAVAGFRPHTAASTNQAAMNAMKLAQAIEKLFDREGPEPLQEWEGHVLQYARHMQRHGVAMGDRSQFGEHPLSS
ncbi:Nn.00g007240.m01.CDS01 [Neocucurbitaria sp. VM-36]